MARCNEIIRILYFDQYFVDNWCTNLNQFSIVLMKQIVANCNKTEQETQKKKLMKPKQS